MGPTKAHFRGELAGLFAAVIEVFGQRVVEEQNRLAHGHAVLGAAKTQHVYPGFPGQIGR